MSHLPLWTWDLATNSMAIGNDAFALGTADNISIGVNALGSLGLGIKNIAIGTNALASANDSNARGNIAIGNDALTASVDQLYNIGIGIESLTTSVNDVGNVAVGYRSLRLTNGGNYNTVLGYSTMSTNVVGDNNVAIGWSAGSSALGSGNIFIGYQSGGTEAGSNKLYIENSSSLSPLIYGEFDNDLVRINGDLDVTGSFSGGVTNETIRNSGTGLFSGGVLSINADTTKFDLTAGTGHVVDNTTDPVNPTDTEVSWGSFSAQTVTNIATHPVTYISVSSAGAIIQSTTIPDATERRSSIYIGVVVHSDNVNINVINNTPTVAIDNGAQIQDLINALGFFSVSGNVVSANGANLNIDKTAGVGFKSGGNFQTDNTKPHEFNMPSLSAATFRYRLQDSTEYTDTTLIDPTQYDNLGVLTTVPSANNATIQRIFIFPSNLIRVQYGQEVFTTFAEAIDHAGTEVFATEPNIDQNGLFLGSLIVKKNATDLSDSLEAKFILNAGIGSGASGSSTTLQGAYDVSVTPEIVTSTTLGAVSFQRGSAADTDDVFEVLNGGGSQVFGVKGNGNVAVSGTMDGRDLATDGTKLDGIEALADVTDEANVVTSLNGATLTSATVATGDKIIGQDLDDSDNIKTYTAQSIADLYDVVGGLDGATIPTATVTASDKVLIHDADDSDNLKTVTTQSVADLKVTELSEDTTPVLAGNLTLSSNDIVGTGDINITGELTITGNASLGGAVETPASVSAAGDYTWLATDHILLKTGITASGDTVTLLATPVDGAQVHIRDSGGNCNGTDTITIATAGADNIEGSSTLVLNTVDASVWLVYYATANNWYILHQQ